jgi:hypothetical protein
VPVDNCRDSTPRVSETAQKTSTFVCKGCYRICQANPRLTPGIQEYCSRPSCQNLRERRWEKKRLQEDPEYRDRRRKTKRDSRKRCAARDVARKREKRFQACVDPPQARRPASISAAPVEPEASAPTRTKELFRPGVFLIRPIGAPASSTRTVEITALWTCPSTVIEQILSTPETDAFLLRRSALGAAEKGVP